MSKAPGAALAGPLLEWFDRHGRKDLPWQTDPSPYRVWVSEIMLQQTQVTTVIAYFERFMQHFPGLPMLAAAPLDRVLHLWSGLGYYARARNLHAAARIIEERHAGELPGTIEELVALPGIGRSTAGAILALSSSRRFAILDGNVKRVLARFHAVDGWPGHRDTEKKLWQLAESHLPRQRLRDYTQALMDLGATVCMRDPRCDECPLAGNCVAKQRGATREYPGKKPAAEKRGRDIVMLIVRRADGCVWLEQKPARGIWGGLWSFPEIASADSADRWCRQKLGCQSVSVRPVPALRHELTHLRMNISPWLIDVTADAVAEPAAAGASDAPALWYDRRAPQPIGLAAPVKQLLNQV